MRRITRSLLLLSCVAFLTACDSRAVIQKPNFIGYKNKVSFTTFVEKLNSLSEANPIMNASSAKHIPSFEHSGTSSNEIEEIIGHKGDGKEIEFSHLNSHTTIAAEGSYDAKKNIYKYSGSQKKSNNAKYYNKERVIEAVEQYSSDFTIQNDLDVKGNERAYIFNEKALRKSEIPFAQDEINQASSQIAAYSLFIDTRFPNEARWNALDDEVKSRYTFYSDDNTLTAVYQYSTNYEIKDDSELVNEKDAVYGNRIMQLTITKTDVKYTDYIRYVSYREVYSYFDSYITIDTYDYSEVKATTSSLKINDEVSLEKVDSSKYRKGDEVISNLIFTALN